MKIKCTYMTGFVIALMFKNLIIATFLGGGQLINMSFVSGKSTINETLYSFYIPIDCVLQLLQFYSYRNYVANRATA